MTEKYKKEENGRIMVGVLYSPGYGAGWYTWNIEYPDMIFDREIVELVLSNNKGKIEEIALAKYPNAYLGGLDDLEVKFLEDGTQFIITEYDGAESIKTYDDRSLIA